MQKEIQTQQTLYAANITKYGSIMDYYKEIFGEDGKSGVKNEITTILNTAKEIKEKTDEFDAFWTGDDDNLSFNDCKKSIVDTQARAKDLLITISESQKHLQDTNQKVTNFIQEYDDKLKQISAKYDNTLNEKLQEVEEIKKDLKTYRDQVVGGSLFRTFKKRGLWSNITSLTYSLIGIILLLCAGGILLWLLLKTDKQGIDSFISSSISFILFTTSFICSKNSKIFRKLAEEYGHKATLLESFVGYREQYKETLEDEEYNQFFREVIEAVKINASDKANEYLKFRWPWEKAVDVAHEALKKGNDIVEKGFSTVTKSVNSNKQNEIEE